MTLDNIRLTISNTVIGSFRDSTDVIRSGPTNNICLSSPDIALPIGTDLLPGGSFEYNNCPFGPVCLSDFSKQPLQFVQGFTVSKINASLPSVLVRNAFAMYMDSNGVDSGNGLWSAVLAPYGEPVTFSQTLYLRSGTYRLSFTMNVAMGSNIPVNPALSYKVSTTTSNLLDAVVAYDTSSFRAEYMGQCYNSSALSYSGRNFGRIWKCFEYCTTLETNIIYAGMKGDGCYCGSSFNVSPVKSTDCTYSCSGSGETCGGPSSMNIWKRASGGSFTRSFNPWISTSVNFVVPSTTTFSYVDVSISGNKTTACVGYMVCGALLDDFKVVQIA